MAQGIVFVPLEMISDQQRLSREKFMLCPILDVG